MLRQRKPFGFAIAFCKTTPAANFACECGDKERDYCKYVACYLLVGHLIAKLPHNNFHNNKFQYSMT